MPGLESNFCRFGAISEINITLRTVANHLEVVYHKVNSCKINKEGKNHENYGGKNTFRIHKPEYKPHVTARENIKV